MEKIAVFLLAGCACAVLSLPLETLHVKDTEAVPVLRDSLDRPTPRPHSVQRRFINPVFSLGAQEAEVLSKIRAKRNDECEKLELCKLHARSRQSFFAAYELYFVNKENAKLWDHRARSLAECEERFGGCYYR